MGTDPPMLWVGFIVLVGLCIEGYEGRGFAGALKGPYMTGVGPLQVQKQHVAW
jgi:hypothetical protein